jgi:excisionase family DNA binding protein
MSIPTTDESDQANYAGNRAAYSAQEAARRLGISEASVWRAIRRGDLTARKLGGRTLIPAHQIDGFDAAA